MTSRTEDKQRNPTDFTSLHSSRFRFRTVSLNTLTSLTTFSASSTAYVIFHLCSIILGSYMCSSSPPKTSIYFNSKDKIIRLSARRGASHLLSLTQCNNLKAHLCLLAKHFIHTVTILQNGELKLHSWTITRRIYSSSWVPLWNGIAIVRLEGVS